MTDDEAEDAMLANNLRVVFCPAGPFHDLWKCTGRVDGCKLSVFGYTRNSVVADWVLGAKQSYVGIESAVRTLRR